ncbi:hypothetical protein ES703_34317 [subsurface metagenome]
MELTTKQAIYSLLVPSFLYGTTLFRYNTVKIIEKGLKGVYGIEVSREHVSRLTREIYLECNLVECEKDSREHHNIYLPRERLFRLEKPSNILTARKWKRDGHQGQENSGKSKGNTNPV